MFQRPAPNHTTLKICISGLVEGELLEDNPPQQMHQCFRPDSDPAQVPFSKKYRFEATYGKMLRGVPTHSLKQV